MSAVQASKQIRPPSSSLERLADAVNKPVRIRTAEDLSLHLCEPTGADQSLSPASIEETETGFRILIPLNGIDPRLVYIFATPHSILVEIRMTNTVVHSGAVYQEVQHQRVTRELTLHGGICEGCTQVQVLGDKLEILCTRAAPNDGAEELPWSEFVQIDTRGSHGRV